MWVFQNELDPLIYKVKISLLQFCLSLFKKRSKLLDSKVAFLRVCSKTQHFQPIISRVKGTIKQPPHWATTKTRRKLRCRYPQDEPPGSETFPAIGQSSDLLLTERERERERRQKWQQIVSERTRKKRKKCFTSINKKRSKDYSLLLVGQDQARVQNIVLRFPSAVPADTHIQISIYL